MEGEGEKWSDRVQIWPNAYTEFGIPVERISHAVKGKVLRAMVSVCPEDYGK